MEKEKLMKLWEKEFVQSYYGFQFSPEVNDYFEGRVDSITNPLVNSKKSYAWYEDWMIKELDGENAELARRMLVVVSKIRTYGIIADNYRILKEVELCLRIGYDFETVVKESVLKYAKISIDDIYRIAHLLLTHLPDNAVRFANRLLDEKDREMMIEKRKSTREIYLAAAIAIRLLLDDKSKYASLIVPLKAIAEKLNGEYITILLYHGWTVSDDLKQLLLQQITSEVSTVHFINARLKGSEMRDFLHEIGAPEWPFYYLLAIDRIQNFKDRIPTLINLYQENKEVFMKVYNQIASSTNPQVYSYMPYLLSVLLKNGEGKEELEKSGIHLMGIFKRFLIEYTEEKNPEFSVVYDESVTLKDALLPFRFSRDLGWGAARLIIGGFAVLYDYSPRARRFMDYLLYFGKNKNPRYNVLDFAAAFFMASRKEWLAISPAESLDTLLQSDAGYTIVDAFGTYVHVQVNAGSLQTVLDEVVTMDLIEKQEPQALELLTGGRLSIDETLVWTEHLFITCGVTKYNPLIDLLSNKSKLVRKKAEEIINNNELSVRPLLEERIPQLKGDALAAAKRLIKRWDNERKYGADFSFTSTGMVTDFCTENYDEANEKYISWITEDLFSDIRFADLSEKAPAIVVKYVISEYMSLEEPYKIKICDKVVAALHAQDLQTAQENIYRVWLDQGADAKKKMLMVPYCIYGSDSQILKLRQQLQAWGDASRGALAAFVVNAIAMNGGSVALMMVDSISNKFPNKQVKNAAAAAFTFAAKALEIPEDVLSDKIVPSLGFSKDGERVFDYGGRTFNVTLMPDFSLSIFDNDKQKVIKSMPSPAANDDAVKAAAAKKEFSELKKQIKATVQSQTNRLEKVLMNGRRWTSAAWNELFVENPIMRRFATGLVWGVYDGEIVKDTFRYMDDGTFNTVDEEEYKLPAETEISLIHPIELATDTLSQWKEQLDDYEIVQPLPQLTAPVVTLTAKEMNGKEVVRYNGTIVKSGKISGLARKYNLVRGDVWDGGSYTCFHWVDQCLNLAAILNFEYMYMGQEYDDNVTLGTVVFYRLNEEQQTDDEPKNNAIVTPSAVPDRFISSVIGAFDTLVDEMN